MASNLGKNAILFVVGGTLYYGIEFLYKTFISFGTCHWSMFLLGGLCFLLIGLLNENIPWEESIIIQGVKGSLIITALELAFGLILNIKLGLGIWDYSNVPLNFMGQICLPFSIAWFFLSLLAIVLDDYLRWKWFGKEKPHYHIKTKKQGEPCN